MSLYGSFGSPRREAMTADDFWQSAYDQPLSLASTYFDQAKGGVLDSYGLGTAIKDFTIPEGEQTTADYIRSALRLANPITTGYEVTRKTVQALMPDSPTLSEEQYKASQWYREEIPWDAGMTEARASALAQYRDAKRVREFYAQKRPITAFLGNMTGQALDPINYVPVTGQTVRLAQTARFGRIAGEAVTSALDAAGNTALFGLATRDQRAKYGDDVSFQAMVTDIAMAALIGGAFGAGAGYLGQRADAKVLARAQERLSTLKNVQESRIALNEAIDAVVRGEDIALGPNATEPLARVAREAGAFLDSTRTEPSVPEGMVRVYHSGSIGEGDTGRWVSTNRTYASDYRADLPLHYLDISSDDPRVNNADIPEQGVKQGFTFNFETTPEEASRLIRIERAGQPDIVAAFMDGKPVGYIAPDGRTVVAVRVKSGRETGAGGVELREGAIDGKVIASPVMGEAALSRFAQGLVFQKTNPRPVDAVRARPDPIPQDRQQAETRLAKPDDYKAMASQFGVDAEKGAFAEESDIAQLQAEGRLTEDDAATLAEAKEAFDDGAAYGEALRSVAGCLL